MVGIFRRILRTIQQAAANTRALPGGADELLVYSHGVIIALAGEMCKYLLLRYGRRRKARD
jgi:hypothetical protein